MTHPANDRPAPRHTATGNQPAPAPSSTAAPPPPTVAAAHPPPAHPPPTSHRTTAPIRPHHNQDPTVLAASQLAALWRRVRWGAAAFCFVQFATYVPGDGIRIPLPLLPLGAALALTLALVNLTASLLERHRPRTTPPGATARRDLALLAADTTLIVAIVQLFAFEPTSAVWVLLVIPILEAGLLGRLRWALTFCAIAVAALLLREALAVQTAPPAHRATPRSPVRPGFPHRRAAARRHRRRLPGQRRPPPPTPAPPHPDPTRPRSRTRPPHRPGDASPVPRPRRPSTPHSSAPPQQRHTQPAVHRRQRLQTPQRHPRPRRRRRDPATDRHPAHRLHDTAARLGGDEFAVLLHHRPTDPAIHPQPASSTPPGSTPPGSTRPDSTGPAADITATATALRAALAQPYTITGHGTVAMSCSVGTATHQPGDTLTTLLRHADQAMYTDKTHTPNHTDHPTTRRHDRT